MRASALCCPVIGVIRFFRGLLRWGLAGYFFGRRKPWWMDPNSQGNINFDDINDCGILNKVIAPP